MIRITDRIAIDESELAESFIRPSGPSGQNVNKLSTALQLRFDVRRSPDGVRARLEPFAGKRLTREGVIVITAQRHRTQERNRADARERRIEGKKRRAGVNDCGRPGPRSNSGGRRGAALAAARLRR